MARLREASFATPRITLQQVHRCCAATLFAVTNRRLAVLR